MGRFLDARALAAVACVVGLLAADFGPVATPDRQLAYRDFSDFYYPLYQKVQQEWASGRLPVWSSTENCGMPLLGNPTAAVLYPGKLIYASVPYPWAAKLYVVGHLLLAFIAMAWMLRGWDVSTVGSTLGGLAYAFGAPVLTQYSNVVFLVGAAWMPLGFHFADRWVRLGRPRAIASLALVLAMQVLGGDPEAAYLTAFASAGYAVGRKILGGAQGRSRRVGLTLVALALVYGVLLTVEILDRPGSLRPFWRISTGGASLALWSAIGSIVIFRSWSKPERSSGARRLLGLAGACGLALALSGAQLVPTLEFIGQSSRNDPANPIDHYAQSLHPARLVEWAFPNVFGATFGLNRNWLTALPPTNDHTIWMTSVSLGVIATLLAAVGLGLRGESSGRRWMIGVALVGILGGLGDFGSPLFWLRAMPGGAARFGALEPPEPPLPREDGLLRDGDGGVYWFLSAALPGFRSFRYPGKLFIPGALAIASLAGFGFDGLVTGRRGLGKAVAWSVLSVGLASLTLSMIRADLFSSFLEQRAEMAKSAFGPFDPIGALTDLRKALAHGAIAATVFLILARFAPGRPRLVGVLVMLAMTADLALANRGQVGTVAQAAYEGEPRTLAAILRSERDQPEPGPFRIFRLPSWPLPRWIETASPDRLEEIVRWERDTLRSKYEQPLGIASTFAYGTAELAEIRGFFEPFRVDPDPSLSARLGIPPGKPVIYYPRRSFDLWNTRYFILPSRLAWNSPSRGFASLLPETQPIYPEKFEGQDARSLREQWGRNQDVQVVRNKAALPRAWVVHRIIPVGPSEKLTLATSQELLTKIFYQDDELWHIEGREVIDPRQIAQVEATTDELRGLAGAREGSEPVQVVEGVDPSNVELEVTLATPGLVILAETFYPGWTLEIDGQPSPIFRTNRAMKGAVVAAGTHRLVYKYRPLSVTIGFGLSALGILTWLILIVAGKGQARPTSNWLLNLI